MENNSDEDSQIQGLKSKPVFLLLLDGWGIAGGGEANAISLAKTKNFSKLAKEYPATILHQKTGTINARYLSLGAGSNVEDENEQTPSDLTKIISESGLKQLKIVDNERLVALTCFFNGHREDKLLGEEWLVVTSEDSNNISSSFLCLKRLVRESIKAVKSENYNFIVSSWPIMDTVASAGDFLETVTAADTLDKAVYRLAAEIIDRDGILIISSTGGNAERMKNMSTDLPDTEITNNPVPFIVIGQEFKGKTMGFKDAPDGDLSLLEPTGQLSDIAATILNLINLNNSKIKGTSLI